MNLRFQASVAIALVVGVSALLWWRHDALERSQDKPIRAAARRYSLEPALVKAVVWRESGFNPRAVGPVGEIGLMQLREAAAKEWADSEHLVSFAQKDCYDPATNILAGTWYLRKLLRRYGQTDNPMAYALADYNAGRGNVLKWNKGMASTNSAAFIATIGFPSTKAYVQAVLLRYNKYRPVFVADRD